MLQETEVWRNKLTAMEPVSGAVFERKKAKERFP
jgi:hypothetical protein